MIGGLGLVRRTPDELRRGLHSFATSRLVVDSVLRHPFATEDRVRSSATCHGAMGRSGDGYSGYVGYGNRWAYDPG